LAKADRLTKLTPSQFDRQISWLLSLHLIDSHLAKRDWLKNQACVSMEILIYLLVLTHI